MLVYFHNRSIYDYYLITKELEYEFEGQFESFWEKRKTEKSEMFFMLIEKSVTNIDKDGNKSLVTISHKIKFIDSARFMTNSLSNFVNKLT